jgi:hypothetical protein
MKNTKLTWTGDVRAALEVTGIESYGVAFNDKHKTCRRLKFTIRENVTDEQLAEMQRVIQARRPNLNVTVSRWESTNGWRGFGNAVVYYRPKTGLYMNHDVAA